MKKFLISLRNSILWITLFPELIYHILREEISDEVLSNYAKYVINIVCADTDE